MGIEMAKRCKEKPFGVFELGSALEFNFIFKFKGGFGETPSRWWKSHMRNPTPTNRPKPSQTQTTKFGQENRQPNKNKELFVNQNNQILRALDEEIHHTALLNFNPWLKFIVYHCCYSWYLLQTFHFHVRSNFLLKHYNQHGPKRIFRLFFQAACVN